MRGSWTDKTRRWDSAISIGQLLLFLFMLSSCRTPAPASKVNLSEPGWTVRQGQAIWRSKRDAPEIAGELLLATNVDGRTLAEFTKTPLPILIAQTGTNTWRIELIAENRTYAGRGSPPTRVLWLHLASGLGGASLPGGLILAPTDDSHWTIENSRSGESIQGYLLPVP